MKLEAELAARKAELARIEATDALGQEDADTEMEEERVAAAKADSTGIALPVPGGGKLRIGGAVRVNYVLGDYPSSEQGAPSRGGGGGNFELDTFRLNLDYEEGPWRAKGEYRFFNGYNMLHTAWAGYLFDDESSLVAGVNRVPFGAGPYGVSQSWFFDQHYYVGLADDMDLGARYSAPLGNWTVDFAYYPRDEGDWQGATRESARYSYDLVNESGVGFRERHQFNLRAVYAMQSVHGSTDLGFSLQGGKLDGQGGQADGEHYAASLHALAMLGNWTLGSQLSYYEYRGAGSTVTMGAYDFPVSVAARAWLPAVSLSYTVRTPFVDWLDFVRPYAEYSSVVKVEEAFNDSDLFILGAAFARGPWFIYVDFARSNGNEFVGGEAPFGDRLGANLNSPWQKRFNINFGYYY